MYIFGAHGAQKQCGHISAGHIIVHTLLCTVHRIPLLCCSLGLTDCLRVTSRRRSYTRRLHRHPVSYRLRADLRRPAIKIPWRNSPLPGLRCGGIQAIRVPGGGPFLDRRQACDRGSTSCAAGQTQSETLSLVSSGRACFASRPGIKGLAHYRKSLVMQRATAMTKSPGIESQSGSALCVIAGSLALASSPRWPFLRTCVRSH